MEVAAASSASSAGNPFLSSDPRTLNLQDLVSDLKFIIERRECRTPLELVQSMVCGVLRRYFRTEYVVEQAPATSSDNRYTECVLGIILRDADKVVGKAKILSVGSQIVTIFKFENDSLLFNWSRDVTTSLRFDVPIGFISFRHPLDDIKDLVQNFAYKVVLHYRSHIGKINLPIFVRMPDHVIYNIFSHLSGRDLRESSFVCKRFQEIAYSDKLWKRLCMKHRWSSRLQSEDLYDGNWRCFYRQYRRHNHLKHRSYRERLGHVGLLRHRLGRRNSPLRRIMVINRRQREGPEPRGHGGAVARPVGGAARPVGGAARPAVDAVRPAVGAVRPAVDAVAFRLGARQEQDAIRQGLDAARQAAIQRADAAIQLADAARQVEAGGAQRNPPGGDVPRPRQHPPRDPAQIEAREARRNRRVRDILGIRRAIRDVRNEMREVGDERVRPEVVVRIRRRSRRRDMWRELAQQQGLPGQQPANPPQQPANPPQQPANPQQQPANPQQQPANPQQQPANPQQQPANPPQQPANPQQQPANPPQQPANPQQQPANPQQQPANPQQQPANPQQQPANPPQQPANPQQQPANPQQQPAQQNQQVQVELIGAAQHPPPPPAAQHPPPPPAAQNAPPPAAAPAGRPIPVLAPIPPPPPHPPRPRRPTLDLIHLLTGDMPDPCLAVTFPIKHVSPLAPAIKALHNQQKREISQIELTGGSPFKAGTAKLSRKSLICMSDIMFLISREMVVRVYDNLFGTRGVDKNNSLILSNEMCYMCNVITRCIRAHYQVESDVPTRPDTLKVSTPQFYPHYDTQIPDKNTLFSRLDETAGMVHRSITEIFKVRKFHINTRIRGFHQDLAGGQGSHDPDRYSSTVTNIALEYFYHKLRGLLTEVTLSGVCVGDGRYLPDQNETVVRNAVGLVLGKSIPELAGEMKEQMVLQNGMQGEREGGVVGIMWPSEDQPEPDCDEIPGPSRSSKRPLSRESEEGSSGHRDKASRIGEL